MGKSQEREAETLAIRALEWVVAKKDLLPVFLGSSGAGESDLRERAGDPVFLASVLDFLLMDDAWVAEFCDEAGLGYDEPMRARGSLPGGQLPNWT